MDWSRTAPEGPDLVRPLKTLMVGDPVASMRSYPARIRARQEVTIAFQVSGVVRDLPVIRGQQVKQGDLLARLDVRDFESRLAAARARHEQSEHEFNSVSRMLERGATTQLEVDRARTTMEMALADRELAQKALEDATLLAPFAGRVADLFIDQHENITVGQHVLRLQDSGRIRVEVNVPEERVAFARRGKGLFRHTVRFDFLPDSEFEAELIEFTTEASMATQTFRAIFEIDPPQDAVILPGMSAAILEYTALAPSDAPDSLYVPVDAVLTDSDGTHAVWVVEATEGEEAKIRRTTIDAGEVLDDWLVVRSGLTAGQQIAAAGIHHLREGQRVRPLGRVSGRGE